MVEGPRPITGPSLRAPAARTVVAERQRFADLLRVSEHAKTRLTGPLTEQDRSTLDKALTVLSQKGARSSLVVTGTTSYLVSVPNRTIITAFSPDRLHDSVVSGIDSVYFAPSPKTAGPQSGGQ